MLEHINVCRLQIMPRDLISTFYVISISLSLSLAVCTVEKDSRHQRTPSNSKPGCCAKAPLVTTHRAVQVPTAGSEMRRKRHTTRKWEQEALIHLEGFPAPELTHREQTQFCCSSGNSHPQANPKASINLLIVPLGSLQGEEDDYLGSKVSRSQDISTISCDHLRVTVGIALVGLGEKQGTLLSLISAISSRD